MMVLNIKPISLNPANLLVWSDLHIGHDREFIYKVRGFDNIEDHDSCAMSGLRGRCSTGSTLLLLGDTLFGKKSSWKEFLDSFDCAEVIILPGNHFAGLPAFVSEMGTKSTYNGKRVRVVGNYFEFKVGSQFVVASHYPISSWNKCRKGSWMLHGHCHGNSPHRKTDHMPSGKILDVGFDCFRSGPLHYNEIKKLMESK